MFSFSDPVAKPYVGGANLATGDGLQTLDQAINIGAAGGQAKAGTHHAGKFDWQAGHHALASLLRIVFRDAEQLGHILVRAKATGAHTHPPFVGQDRGHFTICVALQVKGEDAQAILLARQKTLPRGAILGRAIGMV